MSKLILVRKGNEVFCDGRKLTIIAQATKGPGKEVVKIDGLAGSNGQKFVSLSKLVEGENVLECTAKATTSTVSSKCNYVLTVDEQAEVNELQARIDAIIEAAKARYVSAVELNCDITQMSQEDKLAKATQLEALIARLKASE